jgi:hypothetical protein
VSGRRIEDGEEEVDEHGEPGRRDGGAGSGAAARGRRGGARAGGRRWPRQVGPTCRRLRERGGGRGEREEAAERAGCGPKADGPRVGLAGRLV